MEKQEVRIENPVTIGGVTMIPVAKVLLNYWQGNGGISFFGIKQLVGVVVVSVSAKRAFRITGEEIPLEQLIQEAPGLEEILERI